VSRTTILIAVGVLVWFVGWYQAAGKADSDEQTAPLNLAVFGVVLAGVGQLCWVLDGRRAVGRRRRELIGEPGSTGSAPPESVPSGRDELRLAGGGRYYHRPDCALAIGREPEMATRGDHEAARRSPCGVCAP
jgi:hypothetical protein